MFKEEYWTLVGERRGRVWLAGLDDHADGEPHRVAFDWSAVLGREEEHGDVIGFLHTHPPGHGTPSARDVRTMRAWVSCFGKALLCAIVAGDTCRTFVFQSYTSEGVEAELVERFGSGALVVISAVDPAGEQPSAQPGEE